MALIRFVLHTELSNFKSHKWALWLLVIFQVTVMELDFFGTEM